MKNKILILLAMIFVSLASTAFAADSPEDLNGFYDIGTYQNVDIKPYSGNAEVNATTVNLDSDEELEKLYDGSDRLEVSYKAATNGGYYSAILVEGSELPTKDNEIIYIDLVMAESNTVDFNVYPLLPKKATPLSLYISSNVQNSELIKVPLNYYLPKPPYVLGDVDNDGKWNAADALIALQIGAGLRTANEQEFLAADVNQDSNCNVLDALMILQYGAGLRTSFE